VAAPLAVPAGPPGASEGSAQTPRKGRGKVAVGRSGAVPSGDRQDRACARPAGDDQ